MGDAKLSGGEAMAGRSRAAGPHLGPVLDAASAAISIGGRRWRRAILAKQIRIPQWKQYAPPFRLARKPI